MVDFARGHYHFNHRAVGKKSSAPGTAAAKVRYMLRAKACEKVVTVGLSTHPKALERVANENEQNSRANARVCDTFIVGLPVQMDEAERIATTRSFLWQLTDGGKARAFAAFHGTDSHNPHIHIMFFDRGPDGKRVQGMSERGSTERMRILWENACNAKLEEYGYEVRIDRRTLEAQKELAPESPEVPLLPEAETVHSSVQEEAMVIEREGKHPPYVHVRDALNHDLERRHLQYVQSQAQHYELTKLQAEADKERLSEIARQYRNEAYTAERLADVVAEQLKDFTRPNGKLRGIEIPLIAWKTPKRVRGEELTREKALYEQKLTVARQNAKDAEHSAGVAENSAREAQLSAEANQRELDASVRAFGDKATLKTADKILDASIQSSLSKVTLSEIYADFENGEITGEEARHAFELLGEHGMVAAVEQRMAQEEGMDPANDNEIDL